MYDLINDEHNSARPLFAQCYHEHHSQTGDIDVETYW